jgi:hypothetical protein
MPKNKQPKLKCAAVLTIRDGANMSRDGKRRIAAWLQRQMNFFKRHSKELSPSFRARYLYQD